MAHDAEECSEEQNRSPNDHTTAVRRPLFLFVQLVEDRRVRDCRICLPNLCFFKNEYQIGVTISATTNEIAVRTMMRMVSEINKFIESEQMKDIGYSQWPIVKLDTEF